jgi:hypothetical protein
MKLPHPIHLLLVSLGLVVAHSLHAQDAGDVVVTNDPVSIISVSSTAIVVPDPTAGDIKGGTGVNNTGSPVLRITTNQEDQKITVQRDNTLPAGATLTVALGTHSSPLTGGAETTVTTSETDFITGISNLASNEHDASGIPLIYKLTLSENTPAGGFTVSVTYTIKAET